MAIGFYSSYSKAYGQIYIQDDHFFSMVAIASGAANFLSRILGGKTFDLFGFKVTMAKEIGFLS